MLIRSDPIRSEPIGSDLICKSAHPIDNIIIMIIIINMGD